jgi:predicted flap endonuclease-1-like 5' DNA nuclease
LGNQAVTGKTSINPTYRKKPVYSTQLEEFKESGALYEDKDVVFDGKLVSLREEAFAPLQSNVYEI